MFDKDTAIAQGQLVTVVLGEATQRRYGLGSYLIGREMKGRALSSRLGRVVNIGGFNVAWEDITDVEPVPDLSSIEFNLLEEAALIREYFREHLMDRGVLSYDSKAQFGAYNGPFSLESGKVKESRSVCHGAMASIAPYATTVVTFPNFTRWQCSTEDGVMYLQWLLNDSPYADVFLDKDAEDVAQGFLIDLTLPNTQVMGGLISSRLPHEAPLQFEVWVNLVKQGVSKHAAFLLCHYVSDKVFLGVGGYGRRLSGYVSSHLAIATVGITDHVFSKFVANDPGKFREASFAQGHSTYTGVHAMYQSPRQGGGRTKLAEKVGSLDLPHVTKVERSSGWGMSKTVRDCHFVTAKEGSDVLFAFAKEYCPDQVAV